MGHSVYPKLALGFVLPAYVSGHLADILALKAAGVDNRRCICSFARYYHVAFTSIWRSIEPQERAGTVP